MFTAGAPITALALGMIWGLAAWVFVSPAQVRVVELAGPQADVASSVAVSAFNVGNAAGALLGGIVVATWGVTIAPIASAVFVLLGLGTIVISTRFEMRSVRQSQI
jgi:MFS transporter, DHA1 family, inner membrane transport protein